MKPFWEDEYLNKEKSTFGNPSKEVKEFIPYLKKMQRYLMWVVAMEDMLYTLQAWVFK